MTDRTIYRGDSYVIRRQLFHIALANVGLGAFDMTDCTILTTYKQEKTDPNEDPNDSTAPLKGSITFDGSGNVTANSNLVLPDGKTAGDGELHMTADRGATLVLPLETAMKSDVEVIDANGEHFTIESVWTLTAIDGVTNRSS